MSRRRNFQPGTLGRNIKRYDTGITKDGRAYDRARDIYEAFYDVPADEDFIVKVKWPEVQSVLGQATAIGYRSNKWEASGKYNDYIHQHDKPYPQIIRKESPGDDPPSKTWAPPKEFIFSFLGYTLDLQFLRDGEVMSLDFTDRKDLPLLCADNSRRLLLIIPQNGAELIILHSPILRVTPRGIEH